MVCIFPKFNWMKSIKMAAKKKAHTPNPKNARTRDFSERFGRLRISGARNIDNILTNTLLPDMSRELLASMAEGRKLTSLRVGIGEDGKFVYNS